MTPPLNSKRADIQGLRAIAALAVTIFHATPFLSGGFVGVDIFFVISGYLMVSIALKDVEEEQSFIAFSFLLKRFERIYPPMLTVIVATIVIGALLDTPMRLAEDLPWIGLTAILGVVNFDFFAQTVDYFASYQSSPLLHLWSLAVELQYYLLFTIIFGLIVSKNKADKMSGERIALNVGLVFSIMTIASFFVAQTILLWSEQVNIQSPHQFSFFLLPTRLWEFGIGVLAFVFVQKWLERLPAWFATALQVLGGSGIIASFFIASNTALTPGLQVLPAVIGTGLLLACGERGMIAKCLSSEPMQFFGDRSYSIYLWQGPLIVFAKMLFASVWAGIIAAVLSIAIASVSYRLIEPLFNNRKTAPNLPRRLMRISSSVVITASLVAVSMPLIEKIHNTHAAPMAQRATTLDQECARQRGRPGIEPCHYGDPSAPVAFLIGDSHAGAVSQAFIDAALLRGYQAAVATASACSVPDYPEALDYRKSCIGYIGAVLEYAETVDAEIVAVMQFSDLYVNDLGIGEERWRAGLEEFVDLLRVDGRSVLLIGDNPRFRLPPARPLWVDNWAVYISQTEASAEITEAELSIALQNANAKLYRMSTLSTLCPSGRCGVMTEGNWSYTDSDHLSIKGAELLKSDFVTAFEYFENE